MLIMSSEVKSKVEDSIKEKGSYQLISDWQFETGLILKDVTINVLKVGELIDNYSGEKKIYKGKVEVITEIGNFFTLNEPIEIK